MKTNSWSVSEILHIFVLCSLAIARPVFDQLSRNPEFLIVRGSTVFDGIGLVLVLCVLIPSVLCLCLFLAGLVSTRLRRAAQLLLIFFLVVMIALPGLKHTTVLSASLLLILSSFIALIFIVTYHRLAAARSAMNFLLPLLVIIPGWFLFSISKTVRYETNIGSVKVQTTTPIVMVVFDEMPVISLLDEGLKVDASRFPNFARLMQNSCWFRNTTSVSSITTFALPAILTGNYPAEHKSPTIVDYPENLFSLFKGSYEMRVVESASRLCPAKANQLKNLQESGFQRFTSMMLDLSAIYLHILTPEKWTNWLPSVTETWGDFWELDESRRDRVKLFSQFLSFVTPQNKPTLYFLHIMLPHTPWKYMPSGKQYSNFGFTTMRFNEDTRKGGWWGTDESAVDQGLQRHLLQMGLVDKLLGNLIEHLKKTGLYDRSLIVVTADHGVGFQQGESMRKPMKSNAADILLVPLFIKMPDQKEGQISDRRIETIDILPTMANILRIKIPWKMDGRSALNSSLQERKSRTFITREMRRRLFRVDIRDENTTLRRKISVFGSGNGFQQFFKLGPDPDLIGRHLQDLRIQENSFVTVQLADESLFDQVDLNSKVLPLYIYGRIRLKEKRENSLKVAIAINGIIQTVTKSHLWDGPIHMFRALVPESSFHQGKNSVDILVLPEIRSDPVLRLKRIR
jgi:arylsulfatase A-like enzyme